jgi:hypothetical protein
VAHDQIYSAGGMRAASVQIHSAKGAIMEDVTYYILLPYSSLINGVMPWLFEIIAIMLSVLLLRAARSLIFWGG